MYIIYFYISSSSHRQAISDFYELTELAVHVQRVFYRVHLVLASRILFDEFLGTISYQFLHRLFHHLRPKFKYRYLLSFTMQVSL